MSNGYSGVDTIYSTRHHERCTVTFHLIKSAKRWLLFVCFCCFLWGFLLGCFNKYPLEILSKVMGWGWWAMAFGKGRKEGNVLFNDAINTFYLRLYSVRHMVKNHSDSERGNPLPQHGLFFPISSKGSFVCIIPQTG